MTAIHCPRCHAAIAAQPEMAGQNVLCPKCRQLIHLPAAEVDFTPPLVPLPQPEPAPLSTALHSSIQSPAMRPPHGPPPTAQEKSARYTAQRNAIGGAVLISWGVLMALLVVAAVLVWRLKVSRDARLVAQMEEGQVAPAAIQVAAASGGEQQADDPFDPFEASAAVPAETNEQAATETPPVSPFEATPSGFDEGNPPAIPASSGPITIPPGIAARTGSVGPSSTPPGVPAPQESPPAPTAPASVTPTSPASTASLANVPAAVRLPSLVSSAKEKLLALPPGLADLPTIGLRSLAADIPATAAIFTEPDDTRRAWRAYYVFDLNTGANKTQIGTFHIDETELSFAWASPQPVAALCHQLGNCLMELRLGDELHLVQLREQKALPPLVLDMNEDRQILEFPLSDLPKAESIRLELRELVNFSQGASLRNNMQELPIGKETVLEFSEMPGAEISILLFRASKMSPLQVRLEPIFRENSATKYDLTLERLDALAEAVDRSLDRDRQQLPVAKDNLEDEQRALSQLKSKRPGNIQLLGPWQQLVTRQTKAVDRAADKVKQLARRIPENEARLKAVPKIKRFLQSLHQQGELRYALVAECGEHDLVLADGTKPLGAE
jgi:hypothetical protein